MSKRLALFTNSAELFLSHRQHLARGAQHRGYEVIVMCPASPSVAAIEQAGFKVVTVQLSRKGINPFSELGALVSIWRALKSLRPTILHNFTIKCVLYGTLAGRLTGCPSVVNTVTGRGHVFLDRGLKARVLRKMLGAIYRVAFASSSVRFVFQNEDDLELYVANGWVNPERVLVIAGTGVDTDRFSPAVAEPEGPVRIVFAGRFLKEKGIVELLSACDQLFAKGIHFKLLMCGQADPGNPSSLSDEFLRQMSARPYVEELGQRADMESVYRGAHVVCLPSYGEGLPLTLVEAAASGKALVATDVPGCREVVSHGENGFLVPPMDAPALAAALQELISNKALRIRFGRRSRELALERFAKAKVVELGLNIYAEEQKAAS